METYTGLASEEMSTPHTLFLVTDRLASAPRT